MSLKKFHDEYTMIDFVYTQGFDDFYLSKSVVQMHFYNIEYYFKIFNEDMDLK